MEGICVGDVVDDDGHGGVADVGWNEGPKSFLSGSIPQLKSHGPVLKVHRLGEEVDADGGLVGVVEGVVHEPGDEGCFAD